MTREEAHTLLIGRYVYALTRWHESAAIREAAGTLGMAQREYCDRVVAGLGALSFVSHTTAPLYLNYDEAYREAVLQRAERQPEAAHAPC